MEIDIAVDIGNTRSKLGFFHKNEMIEEFAFPNNSPSQGIDFLEKYPAVKKIIVSTVSKEKDVFTNYLRNKFNNIIFLDDNVHLPVKNLYKTPKTLGKDRLAAVAGAHSVFPGENVLIIDAGSAITFDFINSENEYSGGNISPGLEMRFKALNEFTNRLPLVSKSENFPQTGYDTESSLLAGVQWGMIYETEGYINYFNKKYTDLKIILTGGDAYFFDKKLKYTIFVFSNLVLKGLIHILHFNEKKF